MQKIILMQNMVSEAWELRAGDIIEVDPIRAANWVAAGWADFWEEEDERAFGEFHEDFDEDDGAWQRPTL